MSFALPAPARRASGAHEWPGFPISCMPVRRKDRQASIPFSFWQAQRKTLFRTRRSVRTSEIPPFHHLSFPAAGLTAVDSMVWATVSLKHGIDHRFVRPRCFAFPSSYCKVRDDEKDRQDAPHDIDYIHHTLLCPGFLSPARSIFLKRRSNAPLIRVPGRGPDVFGDCPG